MSTVVPRLEGLNCPNCGAPQVIRGFGHTLTVVCPDCHSVLDAKDPKLRILQQATDQRGPRPRIPLGTRGTLQGTVWEAIGFQERCTESEGTRYCWREYVLFNPYKGFRYLTEYNGHWNFVRAIDASPGQSDGNLRPLVTYRGQRYIHFQTGEARTTWVLGEFPWQARVGETVTYRDYISPPRMLSSETSADETTWSLGEYLTGDEVWRAFQLQGKAPEARGIFANQPAPPSDAGGLWVAAMFLLLVLLVMALGFATFSRQEKVLSASYSFTAGAVTTPTFELKGRPSDVQVVTVINPGASAFINYALINVATGQGYNFGRNLEEVRDAATVAAVPSGRYYLLIDPEPEPGASPGNYEVTVRRDVPVTSFYWIAGFLLLIPPAIKGLRAGNFETRRWQESDYASG